MTTTKASNPYAPARDDGMYAYIITGRITGRQFHAGTNPIPNSLRPAPRIYWLTLAEATKVRRRIMGSGRKIRRARMGDLDAATHEVALDAQVPE